MAIPVFMPRLGLTMEEGTIVAWPKAPGERVEKGEIVLVIETEKSEVEIPATASGWLRHLYVQAGETVPAGVLLAALTASPDEAFDSARFAAEHGAMSGETSPATSGGTVSTRTSGHATGAAAAREEAGEGAGRGQRIVATPRARRLADELGVDLAAVRGSGPGGRITDDDVRAAAARPRPALDSRASGAAAGELVDAGGGILLEIFVTGAGNDVVLLPGFGSDLSVFASQVDALAKDHRVIGIHPRGTGRSTAPEQELYRVGDGAADVLAVVERQCPGPIHVVGASLGAAVALELAFRAPDRVASVVLVTPFLSASPRLLLVLDAWTELVRHGDAQLGARVLLPWLFSETFLAQDVARSLAARGLARMLRHTPAAALERWARGLAAWSGSRSSDLASLAPRALVLHGGGDLLVSRPAPRWESAPLLRARVIPASGHALSLEASGEVTAAILEHLRGRD